MVLITQKAKGPSLWAVKNQVKHLRLIGMEFEL